MESLQLLGSEGKWMRRTDVIAQKGLLVPAVDRVGGVSFTIRNELTWRHFFPTLRDET